MGLYITENDVETRLIGKVRFTEDPDEKNKMPRILLRRLIEESEADVEQDLSPRYFAPFQTEAGESFKKLPRRPTGEYIRTICEIKAVIRVLETDFGSGTSINGEAYTMKLRERYKEMLDKLMRRKGGLEDTQTGWMYPSLPGLKLNYFNTQADDGYMGMVTSTTQGDGAYPRVQVNDPSENFTNAVYDDLG